MNAVCQIVPMLREKLGLSMEKRYRPGTRSFLNLAGKALHLKGICRSPKTNTSCGGYGKFLWLIYFLLSKRFMIYHF